MTVAYIGGEESRRWNETREEGGFATELVERKKIRWRRYRIKKSGMGLAWSR